MLGVIPPSTKCRVAFRLRAAATNNRLPPPPQVTRVRLAGTVQICGLRWDHIKRPALGTIPSYSGLAVRALERRSPPFSSL